MWSLHNLLLVSTAVSCVTGDVILVFGYEGIAAKVPCKYPAGHEDYEKYLCKNDCKDDDDVLIRSKGNNNKYSTDDDQGALTFTVTISDLRLDDAGKYWCGVTKDFRDIYEEVKLSIRPDRCCDTVDKTQSIEEGSVTISCPYDSQSVDKLKFFCRGNRPSTCLQQALITSSNTQHGRFRLSDDRKSRIFTVTISSLTLNDSGSYLCGVQRNSGFDDFSAVELEVKEWCCVESKNLSGIVGRTVTFQCPYPPHHRNNMMFLCKGDERSDCTYMTYQGRFTLHNVNATFFSVVITKLEAEDSGTYWCRSDPKWSVGNYTQFHLTVVDAEEEEQRVSEESIKEALYWLFAALPVLLLILIIILVKVWKTKRRQMNEAAVDMNTSKLQAVNAQDVTGGKNVYKNPDVAATFSQQQRRQRTHFLSGDADEDKVIYANNPTEQIYCNHFI